MRLRIFSTLFFCSCLVISSKSQVQNLWQNRDYLAPYEQLLINKETNFHHDLKPYLFSEVEAALAEDSLIQAKSIFPNFTAWMDHSTVNRELKVAVFPLLDLGLGYDGISEKIIYTAGAGAGLQLNWGKKFSLYADFQYSATRFPGYLQSFIHESEVVPGQGFANGNNPTKYLQYSGYISYSPIKYFNFQVGNGKNFIGNGYRSLLLSDNAYNNPYLKLNTSIWNIKYVNLYSLYQDIQNSPGNPAEYRYKLSSSHYLSWNVTKRLTVGVYEAIMWQTRDTLSQRNFDINYINPIIFYRPVEYSVGSPDNALIGLNLSYELGNNTLLYGQLVIDEFLLKEIRDRNGWWANKFGGQLGVKLFDVNSAGGLDIQLEANLVRPFTYSHGSVVQNFGHFNQALAHPIGANFYEGLTIIRYKHKNWQFENKLVYGVYGRDPDRLNLGGDIFKSYKNPTKIYGNKITQGIRTDLIVNTIRAYRVLETSLNLQVFGEYTYRMQNTEGFPIDNSHIFSLGISTAIGNRYYDF